MIHSYPWYFKDWQTSKTVAKMTLAERGLYREMIDLLYGGGATISDSPEEIALLIRRPVSEVRKAWPKVIAAFQTEPNGRITHAKVTEVYQRIKDLPDKRSNAGRVGANARWAGKRHGKQDAIANAFAIANGCGTSSLSISSSISNYEAMAKPAVAGADCIDISPYAERIHAAVASLRPDRADTIDLIGAALIDRYGTAMEARPKLERAASYFERGVLSEEWKRKNRQFCPSAVRAIRSGKCEGEPPADNPDAMPDWMEGFEYEPPKARRA